MIMTVIAKALTQCVIRTISGWMIGQSRPPEVASATVLIETDMA
jgi:hypothetical protein